MTSTFGSRSKRHTGDYVRTGVVLLGVIALVVGVVAAVRGYTGNYQPLGPGTLAMPPGSRLVDTGTADGSGRYRITWKAGQKAHFGTTLHNDGPWDVEVLSVTPAPPARAVSLLAPVQALVSDPDARGFEPTKGAAFEPFTLEPGEEQFVLFQVKVARCVAATPPKDGSWVDTLEVRWRALGVEHRDLVPLGYRIGVGVRGLTRCK